MRYDHVSSARFLARPNRFIARVLINGAEETVHVKNTGRCRELLVPEATIYLSDSGNPKRKTRYDLIAVEKGERLINMDSQAPNAAAIEWLRAGHIFPVGTQFKPEYKYGDSRIDVGVRFAGLSLAQAPGLDCSATPPFPTRSASLGSRGGPGA